MFDDLSNLAEPLEANEGNYRQAKEYVLNKLSDLNVRDSTIHKAEVSMDKAHLALPARHSFDDEVSAIVSSQRRLMGEKVDLILTPVEKDLRNGNFLNK